MKASRCCCREFRSHCQKQKHRQSVFYSQTLLSIAHLGEGYHFPRHFFPIRCVGAIQTYQHSHTAPTGHHVQCSVGGSVVRGGGNRESTGGKAAVSRGLSAANKGSHKWWGSRGASARGSTRGSVGWWCGGGHARGLGPLGGRPDGGRRCDKSGPVRGGDPDGE